MCGTFEIKEEVLSANGKPAEGCGESGLPMLKHQGKEKKKKGACFVEVCQLHNKAPPWSPPKQTVKLLSNDSG